MAWKYYLLHAPKLHYLDHILLDYPSVKEGHQPDDADIHHQPRATKMLTAIRMPFIIVATVDFEVDRLTRLKNASQICKCSFM